MYQKGQFISVTISDLAEGDKCFARLEDGMSVFVQGKLAVGDTVEAEVRRVKKKYLEAVATKVISPSPNRVSPQCAHFGVCGGCKWQ
ncbi:MAG: TRAM domain-containing protein, partial [Chlorobiales bacterium]|nr:TRAM domain-containing protein [Chlorobiales bacterium]